MTVVIFIVGTLMMSCKSSTKEEKDSQENVQVAKENIQDAKDSLAVSKKVANEEEWKNLKKKTDSVINDNKAKIAVLKLKIEKTGVSIDANYQKKIDTLEQKNKDIKVKMDAYINDADSDWQSFKLEFKHDMDGLGQAFKDLMVDNKNNK
jgi:hypothetical protein